MTPEETAARIVEAHFHGAAYMSAYAKPELIDDIVAALSAERARAIQAITSVANDLPADVDDGFYSGYKLALRNALAAVRKLSEG